MGVVYDDRMMNRYLTAIAIAIAAMISACADDSTPLDCTLADYRNGEWVNEAGDVIATAPTEDSMITVIADCDN